MRAGRGAIPGPFFCFVGFEVGSGGRRQLLGRLLPGRFERLSKDSCRWQRGRSNGSHRPLADIVTFGMPGPFSGVVKQCAAGGSFSR